MRKLLTLALSVVVITTQLFAQTRMVTGKVTDAQGVALPNASVTIKGTTTGTTTNSDGIFSLNVPSSAVLVISSVGYINQEIAVGNQSSFSVKMLTGNENMDEVIVIAYGTIKKSDYTGSAAQVNYDEFKNRPLVNVANVLVGSTSGVQTSAAGGAPGSTPAIRIRGFGSFNASSSPLYVVDNVPYDGGLANINIEDVESITVLKDAATTALYGARAANGVIMITTKKGKKGRNSLNFKVTRGYSSRGLPEFELVNATDYYPLMWESYRNTLLHGTNPQSLAQANQNATNGIKGLLGYNPFNVPDNQIVGTDGKLNANARLLWADDLDWTKELVRQGIRTDANVSMAGGAEKSDYFMSFGFVDEKGYIIRSDWQRFAGRVNLNSQPVNWFKMGLNLSGSVNKSNQASDGSSTGLVNPFYFSRAMGPIYPVYAHDPATGEYLLDASGNRFYDLGNMTSLGLPVRPSLGGRHIIAETKWNENLFKRNTLSARSYGDIIFTPWLKFTSNISVDLSDYMAQTYENTTVGDGAPAGRARKSAYKETSYTFNQILNFNKQFGIHNITALAAHENYDYNYSSLDGFRQGQIVDGNIELTNFTTVNSLTSLTDKARIESYFGRANYDYDGKYYVSASVRRDGNSKFSPDVRWASFWGAGAGWRIDRESFMSTVHWVNQLKLRTSYGQVGNEGGISLYAYQALYSPANNALEPGFRQGSLPSPDLTWESSKTFDVGVDFSLFKNRVYGSIEYYNRVTDRMIFDVSIPVSNGNFSISQNIGAMFNRGIELDVKADVVRTADFVWNVGVNATTIKNQITRMPEQNPEIINGTKKLMVGKSIYDYWLREWRGVNPENGDALYTADSWNSSNSFVDAKGDTLTNQSNNGRYMYMGSAIPDVYGGLSTSLKYRGLELSMLFNYQLGGLVYDGAYAARMHNGTYGSSLHIDALKRWQNPGDVTDVPRLENSKTGVFDAASSRWLTNASFLNVRTISLAYSLPHSLTSKIQANNVSVYVSGENLYLFSHRKGMNVNESFAGTTSNSYSPSRVITAGINVNF
ncbi:MAG: SusC/RagA family TonB-linked outer membrane protein [Flavisolibacter sp.]